MKTRSCPRPHVKPQVGEIERL